MLKQTKTMSEKYITKKEIAELFSVSSRTVERWCRLGLPHLVIGAAGISRRFKPSDVEKWLEARREVQKR